MFWGSPAFRDTGIRRESIKLSADVFRLTSLFPSLLLDATFTPVSSEWFWHRKTQAKLRKHFWGLPAYQSQAWDCENFSVELNQWLCKEAARASVQAAPESLVMCVENKQPFAGVQDGRHALNLVFFDTGPRVIEPQSIRNGIVSVAFEDYPNKAFQIYQ